MTAVSTNLSRNRRALQRRLGSSPDIVYREFVSGFGPGRQGLLVFVAGLAETAKVEALVTAAVRFTRPPFEVPESMAGRGADPPITPGRSADRLAAFEADPMKHLAETVLQATQVKTSTDLNSVAEAVLTGQTALLLDGAASALLADSRWNLQRTVQEPQSETEVRGPRDGLVEDLRLNATLLRRRIRDPRFRLERREVGTRTRTEVVLAYIDGLAPESLLQEVRERLGRIQVDGVLESGYIEELIKDQPLSPLSALFNTERPDRVAAALLEGRVAILTDNTPFAMVVPTTFWQFLQAPGDYYSSFMVGTVFRWIRFAALILSMAVPPLYVLLGTFHHEMIPTPLALTMAGGREGTPMPTLIEVLLMTGMFEILLEAGLRLPRPVGQTVSIVGGLVIGEAAVMAGLVSPSTVIVVAAAGLAGFALPSYSLSLAVRLLRIPILLLTGVLGVFGYLTATAVLALHLVSLRSFGAPFLAPVAPLQRPEAKDTLVRAPWWAMIRRPRLDREPRTARMKVGRKPRPPGSGGKRE